MKKKNLRTPKAKNGNRRKNGLYWKNAISTQHKKIWKNIKNHQKSRFCETLRFVLLKSKFWQKPSLKKEGGGFIKQEIVLQWIAKREPLPLPDVQKVVLFWTISNVQIFFTNFCTFYKKSLKKSLIYKKFLQEFSWIPTVDYLPDFHTSRQFFFFSNFM